MQKAIGKVAHMIQISVSVAKWLQNRLLKENTSRIIRFYQSFPIALKSKKA